jgi:hypothetical protein
MRRTAFLQSVKALPAFLPWHDIDDSKFARTREATFADAGGQSSVHLLDEWELDFKQDA